MTTTTLVPVDLVTQAFERRGQEVIKHEGEYKSGKVVYHRTNCPGPNHRNGDSTPSLDYWEVVNDEGKASVYFHCFSGLCTRQETLSALGIQSNLVPGAPTTNYAKRPIITLFDVATHTKLPWQLLFNLGWHDGQATYHRPNGSAYRERGIIIPYYLEDGTEFERSKIRLSLDKSDDKNNPRFKWTEGDGTILYGLPNLKLAREVGYCIINEGESDTATLQICKIPAVGVPGTSAVIKTVHANLFAGIPRIYIIQEKTDEAGKNFPYDVQRQLLATGYTGEILRVPLRDLTKAKDPNELWKQMYQSQTQEQPSLELFGEAFRAEFQKTLDQAKTMDVDTGREGQPSTDIDTSTIDQAIEQQDVIALLNASSIFAQLSELDFTIYKQEIQEIFGKDAIKDLNRVVNESRKIKKQQEEAIARTKESTPSPFSNQGLCRFTPDDAGNGEAMYALFGGKILYCGSLGWMHYTDTHWELDESSAFLVKSAIQTLRARRHAAVDAQIEAIIKATASNASRINGVVTCFRPHVSVRISEFDSDEHLLNCKNGVVDLRSGTIAPHDASQRFTYCIPIEYKPANRIPWTDYLKGVVGGGQEMVDYLQLALGYSLTGSISEECLFYIYGPSRSGKGTVAEVMRQLLPHPLSTMVDFNSFTAKREGDVNNFDLADLKPSRLIFTSESQRNQSLNPAKIKQLTGGDDVRASRKHKDFFTYRPQYKIWMLSNWPVNGDPEDDAMWGRVRVISFPHSFLGHEDKTLKARLKSEANLEGVLHWAVEGAIKWYALGASGLKTPDYVAKTTKAHRDAIDYVQQWLSECTLKEEGAWISNEKIMESYKSWCERNGVTAKQANKLTQSLQVKGYRIGVQHKVKGVNARGVNGLCIIPLESGNYERGLFEKGNDKGNGNDSNDRIQEVENFSPIGDFPDSIVTIVTVTPSLPEQSKVTGNSEKQDLESSSDNDLVARIGCNGSTPIKSSLSKEEGFIRESSVTDQDEDSTIPLAEPSSDRVSGQEGVIPPALNQELDAWRAKIEERIRYNKRYAQRKDVLQTFLWNASRSGYENATLDFATYLARVDELRASGDPLLIKAAIEAMQRTLGEYCEK